MIIYNSSIYIYTFLSYSFSWSFCLCLNHILLNSAYLQFVLTSLVAQTVKSLPAMQETRVPSLGREDPLQKKITTHSSILAWEIPWIEEPDWATSPWGHKESETTQQLKNNKAAHPSQIFYLFIFCLCHEACRILVPCCCC